MECVQAQKHSHSDRDKNDIDQRDEAQQPNAGQLSIEHDVQAAQKHVVRPTHVERNAGQSDLYNRSDPFLGPVYESSISECHDSNHRDITSPGNQISHTGSRDRYVHFDLSMPQTSSGLGSSRSEHSTGVPFLQYDLNQGTDDSGPFGAWADQPMFSDVFEHNEVDLFQSMSAVRLPRSHTMHI